MNDFVGTMTRTVGTFVSDTPLVSTILSAPDVVLVLS